MFEKSIVHSGLSAYRLVRAQSMPELNLKANLQEAVWAERWQRKVTADRIREQKAKNLQMRTLTSEQVAAAKALALDQTRELETAKENLETLLATALGKRSTPDPEKKKDLSRFAVSKPLKPKADPAPIEADPMAPNFNPVLFVPSLSLFDKLISRRRHEKVASADAINAAALSQANEQLENARSLWRQEVERHRQLTSDRNLAFEKEFQDWENRRSAFDDAQAARNAQIDLDRKLYLAGNQSALLSYIEDVLNHSEYPDNFPREQRIEYIEATRTLVVDFELPNLTAIPAVKEIKYVASRSEFQKVPASDLWIRKTYDEVLYQIALRTLFELFKSDEVDALTSIVFNGWVRSIDKATGSETHGCVMSLEARKDEFLAITLAQVEPKACFKKLKGVAASKLVELSPVKPIMSLSTEDKRFVEGYAVVDAIDERTNLAAMDWLDFENLIREVFEKEFSKGGGKVNITQASRDGGVDAIAFDPDPIRGGKLVIQTKRYTNTVGVSAVRDLYGTVHNEGANKGILVTTSDFGPDAYAFAKDKPLTLLSGAELLYLLGQHGHSAKIDLAEAKRIAAENGR